MTTLGDNFPYTFLSGAHIVVRATEDDSEVPSVYTIHANIDKNASAEDGGDETQGAIGDDPALPGGPGTVSAKLRQISADVDALKSIVEDQYEASLGDPLATTLRQDEIIANQSNKTQMAQITDGTDELDIETLSDDDHDVDGKNGAVTAAVLYARINADTIKPLRMDASTHAINTIEYEHHEIHSGSSFSCFFQDDVTDLDNRTVITFLTPAGTKYIHITVAASATAVSIARIREGPTYTNNAGVTLAVYNRNRVGTPDATDVLDTSQNPNTAGSATSYVHDTANPPSEDGIVLGEIPLGAATSPVKSVGGLARGQQEWVLKPATLYSFEIKSLDASDNTHWIELDWYEHRNKD